MMNEAPRPARRRRRAFRPGIAPADRRTIPFDYAFRFSLEGTPGETKFGRIEVSVEAAFHAVSIGYGVVTDVPTVVFGIAPPVVVDVAQPPPPSGPIFLALSTGTTSPLTTAALRLSALSGADEPANIVAGATRLADVLREGRPTDPTALKALEGRAAAALRAAGTASPDAPGLRLANGPFSLVIAALSEALGETPQDDLTQIGPLTAAALRSGIKLNPEVAEAILLGQATADNRALLARAFQVVALPPERLQFTYALFDDATGREFQNEPILNIAGLGSADGQRPARYFARPIEFGPRSVIRLQVTPLTEFRGELHISLQGYKVLGGAGTPTGRGGA